MSSRQNSAAKLSVFSASSASGLSRPTVNTDDEDDDDDGDGDDEQRAAVVWKRPRLPVRRIALVGALFLLLLSRRAPREEPLLMYTSGADPFDRNMTEVLFPTQSFDSSQFSTTDWLLGPVAAAPTGNERNLGHESVAAPAAVPQSTAQISDVPARADLGHDQQQQQQNPFSATTFRGLEASMPQVNHHHHHNNNNPFEASPTPAHPISQPTLYSNIKTASPVPHTPTAASRSFAAIAPDPVGLQRIQAVKQNQEGSDDTHEQQRSSKKRRLTSSSMETPQQPPPLRDEDKLLLQLKDEQSLPWKDIAARFQTETGKVHMIPALQMRYKRLKERLQQWTDPDVEALKQAHEYWETKKFDIISSKMLEFGATEKFSPRACQKKWQEMNPQAEYMASLNVVPSGFSQSSAASVSPQPRQMPGHHAYGSSAYVSSLYAPTEAGQQQYTSMSSAPHASYASAPAFHQHSSYAPAPQSGPQAYVPAPQGHGIYRQPSAPASAAYAQSPVQHSSSSAGHPTHHSHQVTPQRNPTYPPATHPSGSYWQQ